MKLLAHLERLGARLRAEPIASDRPGVADFFVVFSVALVVRVVVVAVAGDRFPPVDDGAFYHVVAERIARGLGYTWLWRDGAVTYAAHYPVGYPALIGAAYALFGASVVVAMGVNAFVGALAAPAAAVVAGSMASRRGARFAGFLVAFEPALVAYTPALMTEAVAGELLVVAAAAAVCPGVRPNSLRAFASGLLLGLSVLVRPQLVVLGPVLGVLAAGTSSVRRSFGLALLVTLTSVAVCTPWTIRNCKRLDRCSFVSANGGWNLYIGSSPLGRGGFAPLERIGVPSECKTVFGEGEKDRCFGNAALGVIADSPARWLGLVPAKLGMTFDYGTAAAYYLGASNAGLVGQPEKTAIGAAELVGQRLLVIGALLALVRAPGARRRARFVVAGASAVLVLLPPAYLGWLGLVTTGMLLGRGLLRHGPALLATSAVLATALTHAVFFGASRYALVCLPALCALAGALWLRRGAPENESAQAQG